MILCANQLSHGAVDRDSWLATYGGVDNPTRLITLAHRFYSRNHHRLWIAYIYPRRSQGYDPPSPCNDSVAIVALAVPTRRTTCTFPPSNSLI